jgi:PAS domain S-box-containing protein
MTTRNFDNEPGGDAAGRDAGDYRLLVDNLRDVAVFMTDAGGRITSWNPGVERVLGYAEAEFIDRPTEMIFTPEDLAGGAHEQEMRTAEAEGRAEDNRWHVRRDGTRFWSSGLMVSLRDAGGRLIGFAKVMRDATEQKLAEEALRESEERYHKLVELSPDAIVVHSGGEVVFINTAGVRLLGAGGPEQVVGKSVLEFVRADYHEVVKERVRRLQEGADTVPTEMMFVRLDGTEIAGEVMSAPVSYRGGLAVQVVARDITDRKRAEEALREADRRALSEYERLLERITELAQTFATARDLNTIFRALKNFALASVPGSGIFISLYDDASRTRTPVYAWSEGEELNVSELPPMPMSDSPHSRAVSTGEVIVTDDFQTVMAGKPIFHVGLERDPRLPQSSLAIPMVELGRVVGAVEVQSTEPGAYRAEHAAAMRMAANLAAVAVENVRLLKDESRAREAAEESNRLKDEFLATLSHELRTPLAAILGWSKLLRTGSLDASMAARALEAVERNAESQKQLIDDILDVSRIITGKLRLDVRPVSLVSVLEGALDSVRPAADAKRITLRVSVAPRLGVVAGDTDRLRQAVWNLLTNAVKFTPEGGTVEVSVGREGSSALIEVADNGRGIDPDFLPFVFDRFRQADASTTRQKGGLGLGLAIVRHIVELHGGTVRAESAGAGTGATFAMTLPLMETGQGLDVGEGEAYQHVETLSTQGGPLDCPPALDGLHVLVADDEVDTLDLLRAVFEGCGARVTAASTAAAALSALKEGRPDVLVSDIGMPDEDGYELIRKVRRLKPEEGGRTPAVALTAYAREEDRRKAVRAGFQTHLSKPAAPDELAEVVASLAGRTHED